MRISIVTGLVFALAAGSAMAQSQPPAQNGPENSVVNTQDSSNRAVTAPVKGANSFTRKQAMSRIERQGFSHVSGLQKDHDGVWRGRAMKGGQRVAVALDYEGNVIAKPPGAGAENANR